MDVVPTIPDLCAEMVELAKERLRLGVGVEVEVCVTLRCTRTSASPQETRVGLTDSDWTYLTDALKSNTKAFRVAQVLHEVGNAFTPGILLGVEEKSMADSISTTIRRATNAAFSLRMFADDRRSAKPYGEKKFRLVRVVEIA